MHAKPFPLLKIITKTKKNNLSLSQVATRSTTRKKKKKQKGWKTKPNQISESIWFGSIFKFLI